MAGTKLEWLAKNDLGKSTLASDAADDRTLFIRGAKHGYRVGKK